MSKDGLPNILTNPPHSSHLCAPGWSICHPADVPTNPPPPIDMVRYCPACGVQHIDEPAAVTDGTFKIEDNKPVPSIDPHYAATWTNPAHRSHLCTACGHIWRPADVPTNGVKAITTKGNADSPINPASYIKPTPSDDTARLDWLQANGRKGSIRLEDMTFKECNVWAVSAAGNDLRETIDVMRAQPKGVE